MKKLIAHSETTEPVLAKYKPTPKKALPPATKTSITLGQSKLTCEFQRYSKDSAKVRVSNIHITPDTNMRNTQPMINWFQTHLPRNLDVTIPPNTSDQERRRIIFTAIHQQLSVTHDAQVHLAKRDIDPNNPILHETISQGIALADAQHIISRLSYETRKL